MEFDKDIIQNEIYSKFPDFKKLKTNPNNWPIIDKYNRRIFEKNKFTFFDWICHELDFVDIQLDIINDKCYENLTEDIRKKQELRWQRDGLFVLRRHKT